MSRKGNCYDNAAMESFWATLKTECFGSFIPKTKEQAKIMIFDYINQPEKRTYPLITSGSNFGGTPIGTDSVSIGFLLALHKLFCLPGVLFRVYMNL